MVDLRPLLSRNCPTATGATREHVRFYSKRFTLGHQNWKDLTATVSKLPQLCESISIAASEFKATVTIKRSNKNGKPHTTTQMYRVERGRTAKE